MEDQISEVHPELQKIAQRIPRFTFTRRNLWLWRFLDRVLWKRETPDDIFIENIHIPCQDGKAQIRLRIYRPKSKNSPMPVLVWFHGGGYIMGKPEQEDSCCVQYVRELGIVVVSVDYRTAPEHPFPIPLEDGYSTLKWVEAHAGTLGIDTSRIAIGGASAGAGLAAVLAQLVCDRDEIQPTFQMLVYPMLDDRTCIRTDITGSVGILWNQDSNRFGWEAYLGQECGAEKVPSYSVPSRREDLSGLPPAWIGVGTLDLFYDEDVAYAQRMEDCGVACELVVVPGAFHGFDRSAPGTQVVQDFRKSQITALERYLFP